MASCPLAERGLGRRGEGEGERERRLQHNQWLQERVKPDVTHQQGEWPKASAAPPSFGVSPPASLLSAEKFGLG